MSPSANPAQAAYQTTYSYDSAGEQVSTTTPATSAASSGATTTTTYDPAGNKLTSTDPDGVTTTYTYAPLGKEASASYSGSSAHSVSYTYDADGNNTGMTDGTGTSSYIWDPFGELTAQTNGAGQTTSYSYDPAGDVTSITYPLPATATWATSSKATYSYYDAGNLSSVTDFNGNKTSVTDNADNLPASKALGSTGDTISTAYDATDTPSSIMLANGSATLQSFAYSDAPSGNILSETDTPASAQTPAAYTYDGQGRVVSMTSGSNSTLGYGYDASGNLTALPTGATGSYDHDGELTASALNGTTTSYTYTANGERLTAAQGSTTSATGTWNGAAQLTSYSDSAANMAAVAYDGTGERASSTATPAGESSVTQTYVWHGNSLIMDDAYAYIYATGSTPAEQVNLSTGAVTYLVSDMLGSVRAAVGPAGALTGSTSYDAWGNPSSAGGLTGTTPFGFAGGYTDPTGLIYLINRYYDPSTGQFLSVDPDVSSTRQPYAYTAGNPVTEADPTGLAAINLRGVSSWAYNNVFNSWTAPSYFSDDCTDFVSQALKAGGGMAQYYGNGSATNDVNWYFYPGYARAASTRYSHSWSVAYDLAVHLLDWDAQTLRYYNSGVQDGDIIFANWVSGRFVRPPSNQNGIDHVGVVTGVQGNGQPYITQHTPAQRSVPLSLWLKYRVSAKASPHVWIMRPNQD